MALNSRHDIAAKSWTEDQADLLRSQRICQWSISVQWNQRLGGTPWWWTYISNGFKYAIFLQGDPQMQVVLRNATALLLDSSWLVWKKTYWLTFNKLTCTAKQPDEDSLVHCCSPIWWSSSLASPVPADPALQRGDLTTFWWPETKNSKATNQSAKTDGSME